MGKGDKVKPPSLPLNAGPKPQVLKGSRLTRSSIFLIAFALLVLLVGLSLAIGSNQIPLTQVWSVLLHQDQSEAATVVWKLRIPRTMVGLAAGAALALGGSLMQALTRNPLADPGILGVNAGAGFAVVLSVSLVGVSGIWFYMWFAFLGAALASIAVYALGISGGKSATPVRLALAGVAISAALNALTQTTILGNQEAFNEFRYWVAGSLEGRGYSIFQATVPFMLAGLVMALLLSPALNALALGDETGKALGVQVARTRTLTMIAITLLCGAATAAAGPLTFVGLAVPFVARALLGPDQRYVAGLCLLLGPVWLLASDILARVVVAPQEIQVGIVASLFGAPFFVAMVRKGKVASL